ncbi:MAG: response regulator [Candidatus Omnitrophota bacterium]|jgi:DNA-binding response OmpR family regulator
MKKNILIVEDEAIIAKSLKLCLGELGYHVFKPVSTGEAAVQSADKNSPDLILMDVRLRGLMNGYDAVTKIRLHSNIPVIYLTGGDQFQIDEKAKNTKPYDYIIKPFDIEVLEKKIRKLLEEQCNFLKAAHAKTA